MREGERKAERWGVVGGEGEGVVKKGGGGRGGEEHGRDERKEDEGVREVIAAAWARGAGKARKGDKRIGQMFLATKGAKPIVEAMPQRLAATSLTKVGKRGALVISKCAGRLNCAGLPPMSAGMVGQN